MERVRGLGPLGEDRRFIEGDLDLFADEPQRDEILFNDDCLSVKDVRQDPKRLNASGPLLPGLLLGLPALLLGDNLFGDVAGDDLVVAVFHREHPTATRN